MSKLRKPTALQTIYIIVFVFTLCFLAFVFTISKECTPKETSITPLKAYGTYTLNASTAVNSIPDNYKMNLKNISHITFHLHFDDEILKGEQINFLVAKTTANVYFNNKHISSYGDDSHPSIVKSAGTEWTYFLSPGITPDDEIKIELQSCYDTLSDTYVNDFLGNISKGSYHDLLKYKLEKNAIAVIGALIILIMGFVLTVVTITFKIMKSPVTFDNISCGIFMMTAASAIIFNFDFVTLIVTNGFLVNMCSFVNIILMLLFFISYMKTYFKNKHLIYSTNIFLFIWSGLILIFFLTQATGLVEYIVFSHYIIYPSLIILASLILFLIIDFRQKNSVLEIIKSISGLLLCVSAIIELTYRANSGMFLGYVFEVGILIYSIIQFIIIMTLTKKSFIQAAKSKKMENELLQSKISVMLSQIQPHFLYNTLVVIRQLCDINPKTAKQAVTEFANYLRGNLDSLTLNTTIPFEKEMEHVENYISLEKKRFGDKINVEYEVEVTDFEVPSLTIQTVVENAIRHGITKRPQGGTVTIRTSEDSNSYIIEIHDNGVGMDLTKPVQQNDNRSHIGMENVRNRVESMCNGSLLFDSTPNIGTTVYMTIPKSKAQQNA
ncbi:MAG: histidine kinase [Acutalibacteraceae bacterium]|nr:histidine kinase [Acutalibacteraceae bacterium]